MLRSGQSMKMPGAETVQMRGFCRINYAGKRIGNSAALDTAAVLGSLFAGGFAMKKITRRSVLRVSGLTAAALALSGCNAGNAALGGGFAGWLQQTFGLGGAASSEAAASSETAGTDAASSAAASEAPAESAADGLPAYDADPLTGEAHRSDGRMVGVMVNNISNSERQNARPQRGLSSADLLIECKVEGGITRFCAVYHDADSIPEVGPMRSGRDQFLQLIMPWQALYYHDGESAPCTKFISVYNYSGLNIGGKSYFDTPTHPHVAHRDSRGRNVAYEHTEFTSGKEIKQAAANAGISLKYPYESTFFRFADYRTKAENKMSGAASGKSIHIVHSDTYKTNFTYNRWDASYKMEMYSRAAGKFENTVDELTGKQLSFSNLLVCFADIAPYPGDSGDVQQVNYVAGGEAYFFTRGGVQTGRWEKASPEHPLKVYGSDGAEIIFNRGKTYLAIVDDDEWSNFNYQ